jgi:anti-sigma B factor antagonist
MGPSVAILWGPITERIVDDVVILDLSSRGVRLSDDDVGRLLAKIRELVNRSRVKILLNLAKVQFIDSEGVVEIVHGFKAVRETGGELALCNVVPRIRHVLVVMKLDALIRSYDSEQAAVESLRARG